MRHMNLDMEIINIIDVKFGNHTEINNGILTINKVELLDFIANPIFESLNVELARPGESVRIIPVKDVIEPRIKITGSGGSFPGFLDSIQGTGEGKTKTLRGCGVVTTGKIVGFQEGIIDMSGIGAEYCYFSKLNNVVIIGEVIEGTSPAKHEEAMRIAGLKAAHYLSLSTKNTPADDIESYKLELVEDLPKVAIVYLIMAQGLLHDNYLYGVDAKRLHPTLVHPNEILDSALVSGNCVVASDKHTTYDHQNNPLIKELYARHGVDLDFKGVIITPVYPGLADKERCCTSAVNISRLMGLDAILIPEEGGGNPDADLMMICRMAEQKGIKTVMITAPNGGEEPVADVTTEADAVIDVGYVLEKVLLPKIEKVIGHPEQIALLSGGSEDSLKNDGSIYASVAVIMGAHNEMGMTKLTTKLY